MAGDLGDERNLHLCGGSTTGKAMLYLEMTYVDKAEQNNLNVTADNQIARKQFNILK